MLRSGWLVAFAGRVRPIVRHNVGQSHVSHTAMVEDPEQIEIVVDAVTSFQTHQHCKLVLNVDALNVGGRVGYRYSIRMARSLSVNRVDYGHRCLRIALVRAVRDDEDR